MSDDIVTRLREQVAAEKPCFPKSYLTEAADEIERLRQKLRDVSEELKQVKLICQNKMAEADELREALAMSHKFAQGWYKRALKAEGHA